MRGEAELAKGDDSIERFYFLLDHVVVIVVVVVVVVVVVNGIAEQCRLMTVFPL